MSVDPVEVIAAFLQDEFDTTDRRAENAAYNLKRALLSAGLKVLPEEPTSAMMGAVGWFDENTPPRYTTRGVWSRMWCAAESPAVSSGCGPHGAETTADTEIASGTDTSRETDFGSGGGGLG